MVAKGKTVGCRSVIKTMKEVPIVGTQIPSSQDSWNSNIWAVCWLCQSSHGQKSNYVAKTRQKLYVVLSLPSHRLSEKSNRRVEGRIRKAAQILLQHKPKPDWDLANTNSLICPLQMILDKGDDRKNRALRFNWWQRDRERKRIGRIDNQRWSGRLWLDHDLGDIEK